MFGTLFAPCFGHWYARSYLTRGFALRVAGITTALAALVAGIGGTLPSARLFAAIGLYAGGTIDDIVMAPGKARRYNYRFQDVAVVPVIRGDSSGLAIAGRF